MTSPSRLSSFSSSLRARPHVAALWGAVVVLAVVVFILTLPHHGPRDDVKAYIDRVNVLSTSFAKDYGPIATAYKSFVLQPKKPAEQEAALKSAAVSLTALRVRMEQLPAPPPARTLKRRLVAYFRQQEAVSRELIGVSSYLPELVAAEKPLGPANSRMRAALKRGGSAKVQAAALTAYADALESAADDVAAIHAPALFKVTHDQQLARLRRSATLMRRLAGALRANDRPLLNRTVKELGSSNTPSNAAARRAIAAFDTRVAKIRELAAKVEQERRRLDADVH